MNAHDALHPEDADLRDRASRRLDELIDEFGEDEVELLYDSFEIHLHAENVLAWGEGYSPEEQAILAADAVWFDAICAEYVRRKEAGTLPWFPAEWATSEA